MRTILPLLALALAAEPAPAAERPHLVVFLADDLGWSDCAPYGGKDVRTPSGLTIGPIRPTAYFGGALDDADDQAFIREGGNFPGGGDQYFNIVDTGPPGIGRNSFRGPRYGALDLSIVKSTGLPDALGLGEAAKLDVRVNLFNAFNNLNLAPFGFFDNSVFADDPNFGVATAGLAGRVIELQARFSF